MTKEAAGKEIVKLIRELRDDARARGLNLTREEIQAEIDAVRREKREKGKVSARRNPPRRS